MNEWEIEGERDPQQYQEKVTEIITLYNKKPVFCFVLGRDYKHVHESGEATELTVIVGF